jgi:hypothetical protein
MFSENALKGGGCRWCISFEHASQTDEIGLLDVVQHVDVCVDRKFSVESAKGLQALLKDPDFLARAMVELAAVADGGKPLCQACHKMEGDNPLVFTGHGVLTNLARIIKDDVFEWPNLEVAADNACNVMAEAKDAMKSKSLEKKLELEIANERLETATKDLDALATNGAGERQSVRCAGQARRDAQEVTTGRVNQEKQAARDEKAASTKEQEKKQKAHDKSKQACQEWKRGKLFTVDKLFEHGKACVKPGFDYVDEMFFTEGGPCHWLVQACRGATVFNPLKMKGKSVDEVSLLVRELKHFQFPEFTVTFLDSMIEEIPTYLAFLDSAQCDWSKLKGAGKHDSKARMTGGDSESWKDDPAELARRVWEWWRGRMNRFTFFKEAVLLVVLVQVSSASVERVFSQLKLILESGGSECLNDMNELRVFERVNRKQYRW